MQCTATSSRTYKQCQKHAILGANVCRFHGGAAPQVQRAARRRLGLADITPERTLLEMARIAYSDVASFFNKDGSLKKPTELGEDQRRALASYEVVIGNVSGGDGKQDTIHKVKLWDKPKTLEMIAKYFKMFDDTQERTPIEIHVTWGSPEIVTRNVTPRIEGGTTPPDDSSHR